MRLQPKSQLPGFSSVSNSTVLSQVTFVSATDDSVGDDGVDDDDVGNDDDDVSQNVKSEAFCCTVCGKSFASQIDFFVHLKSHYEPAGKADYLSLLE